MFWLLVIECLYQFASKDFFRSEVKLICRPFIKRCKISREVKILRKLPFPVTLLTVICLQQYSTTLKRTESSHIFLLYAEIFSDWNVYASLQDYKICSTVKLKRIASKVKCWPKYIKSCRQTAFSVTLLHFISF